MVSDNDGVRVNVDGKEKVKHAGDTDDGLFERNLGAANRLYESARDTVGGWVDGVSNWFSKW